MKSVVFDLLKDDFLGSIGGKTLGLASSLTFDFGGGFTNVCDFSTVSVSLSFAESKLFIDYGLTSVFTGSGCLT